jgi:hypothetical protein
MRWVVLWALWGCTPAVVAPSTKPTNGASPRADCAACTVEGPTVGLSHFKVVGQCRYEVRKGSHCCEIRFDLEASELAPARAEEAPLDGGFSVVGPIIEDRTYEPSVRRVCFGESLEVCGESDVCRP